MKKNTALEMVCNHCRQTVIAFVDTEGYIKFRCPRCGAFSVMKELSRRHYSLDLYLPQKRA